MSISSSISPSRSTCLEQHENIMNLSCRFKSVKCTRQRRVSFNEQSSIGTNWMQVNWSSHPNTHTTHAYSKPILFYISLSLCIQFVFSFNSKLFLCVYVLIESNVLIDFLLNCMFTAIVLLILLIKFSNIVTIHLHFQKIFEENCFNAKTENLFRLWIELRQSKPNNFLFLENRLISTNFWRMV